VLMSDFSKPPEGLGEGAVERLLAPLAIYIEQYHPEIVYDGIDLDPAAIQVARTSYPLDPDIVGEAKLDIIEWSQQVERALHLCNADGVALEEVQAGIQAPGYHFTGYVS
jgi:hypothetical protein